MSAPKVPFVRVLYGPDTDAPSTNGEDVVGISRALSRTGHLTWSKFDRAYNKGKVLAVKAAQKEAGIDQSGIYGQRVHEFLRKHKAVDHPGEWAFDEYAIECMGQAWHDAHPDTALAKANELLAVCRTFSGPYWYGGGHGPRITALHVDQGLDCSSSTSLALYLVGLFNENYAWVSGMFEGYGDAGRGKYVTVHANGEHVWCEFNLPKGWYRMDTSPHGDGPRGPRVRTRRRFDSTFVHRHPRGL